LSDLEAWGEMLDYAVVASAKKRVATPGLTGGRGRGGGDGGGGLDSEPRVTAAASGVGKRTGAGTGLEIGAMERRQRELVAKVDGLASKYQDLFRLAQEAK
jgi:hypothetical protein